jgi:type IV secretion system protein VirB9
VFDDGAKTYILFPANIATTELPPLFLIGEQNRAELVNYRVSGRYMIVDRLFSVAELRLGTRRQQIVRIERTRAREPRS